MPIFDYKCPNEECGAEKTDQIVFYSQGKLKEVVCDCGTVMEKVTNLTSFPGMQSGRHHYGQGTTVMKRINRKKKPKEEG